MYDIKAAGVMQQLKLWEMKRRKILHVTEVTTSLLTIYDLNSSTSFGPISIFITDDNSYFLKIIN